MGKCPNRKDNRGGGHICWRIRGNGKLFETRPGQLKEITNGKE